MLVAGRLYSCQRCVLCLLDPFFPLSFLVNSWFPGMLDDFFQSLFLCALLLFWLCVYHGIRVQVSRQTDLQAAGHPSETLPGLRCIAGACCVEGLGVYCALLGQSLLAVFLTSFLLFVFRAKENA